MNNLWLMSTLPVMFIVMAVLFVWYMSAAKVE